MRRSRAVSPSLKNRVLPIPRFPTLFPYLPRWLIVRLVDGGRAVHSVLGQVHAARSGAPHYTAFRTSPRNRDQLFINPKRSIAFPM